MDDHHAAGSSRYPQNLGLPPESVRQPVCVAAVVAFVASVFGPPGAVVGVGLAFLALRRIGLTGERGKGIAWAAVGLSLAWFALLAGSVVVYAMLDTNTTTGRL